MNRRTLIAGGLLLAGLALWLSVDGLAFSSGQHAGGKSFRNPVGRSLDGASGSPVEGTKASAREQATPNATHAPGRLKEFLLPPLEIRGLTLQAALAKLLESYQEACVMSGETPLRLKFRLPPDSEIRVTALLTASDVDRSIRLLGGLAGMIVQREGEEYLFSLPDGSMAEGSRTMVVSPDFLSRLLNLAGDATGSASFDATSGDLAKLGVLNDPSSISLSGATLTVPDGADFLVLKSLAHAMSSDRPIQYRQEPKVIRIPAGTDFEIPDNFLGEAEIQSLLLDLAQQPDVAMTPLPAVTARPNVPANIEIDMGELIVPTDASGTEFEVHETGTKLAVTATGVGFGQRNTVAFSSVTGDLNPITGEAEIRVEASIEGAPWSPDAGSRPLVQVHPDGSRTVVLVTSTLIDATGRRIRPEE